MKTMNPNWTISADGERVLIWLNGGCIDSLERLDEAETFLRIMRPLLLPRATPLNKEEGAEP